MVQTEDTGDFNTVALPTTMQALRDQMSRETLLETITLLMDNISDGVVLVDPAGHVIYQNASAEKVLGHGPVVASPEHWSEIFGVFHLDGKTRYQTDEFPLVKATRGIETPAYEMLIRPGQGQADRIIRGRAKPLLDANGQAIGGMTCFHDATEHDELMRRMRYRSQHDKTTGVQNGLSIRETIDALTQDLPDKQSGFGVILVNVDRFGLVNNVIGRDAADSLLRRIGRMLQRREDVVAVGRLCADEFVVVVSAAQLTAVHSAANDIVFALRMLELTPSRYNTTLTASVGATWVGGGSIYSTEELLAILTTAVEDAKADGRNRAVAVDLGAMTRTDEARLRVSDVVEVIDQDRLCLKAEAIMKSDGSLLGHEVLTRVCDSDGAPVLPRQFLPIAERFGLIGQLDVRNLSKLLHWMGSQPAGANAHERMHINVSGYTLSSEDCLRDWMTTLLSNIACARRITVEVTETFAMKNPIEASTVLSQIRQLGCQIALDDFGAGYCSFSRLKELPLDYLKIDGALVRDILDDAQSRAILQSVIQLGHALKLPLIAEHACNQQLIDTLFAMGVNYVQGYGVSEGIILTRCKPVLVKG